MIVKHANPCGAAVGGSVAEAYRKALRLRPALRLRRHRGPQRRGGRGVGGGDLSGLHRDPRRPRLHAGGEGDLLGQAEHEGAARRGSSARPVLSAKYVTGGILLQDADAVEDGSDYEIVTEKKPSPEQLEDLLFAWRVARVVKSNAIVLAKGGATVGVGAGQMSRVDSSEIAAKKAGDRAAGSVAASDAFFPFADGVEALAEAGVGGRDTTRRLRPRRGGHRGGQPVRCGDGLHRPPALPALAGPGSSTRRGFQSARCP